MSTDNKVSNLVEQQFPEFVLEEGPNLVAFVKAYYEWLEQANNAIEVSKNLLAYQDIDTTYDKYFEFFHREILGSIPRSLLSDKRILAKYIKDLYTARGSEYSYKLLFRTLFDEEIEFYYPGEDILRASDGRWVQDQSLRVSEPKSSSITAFENSIIRGQTSGATALVERIVKTISAGQIVDELYLININGNFQDNERITLADDSSVFATVFNIAGPLQGVQITRGGFNHQTDDLVSITSISGTGARGVVTETSDTSAIEWAITDGGSGYTNNAVITISGGSGVGSSFIINSISNTEIIAINQDIIQPFANVILNTGSTFVSLGANTSSVSANLASANVSSVLNAALSFANLTVGTINAITTTSQGFGYSTLPTATVVEQSVANLLISDGAGNFKGLNAIIEPTRVAGTILEIRLDEFGTNYSRYDPVTITNLSRTGTENAIGNPFVSGVVNYPGRYIDTKGWLSWNNRLQDNFYYQEFSYEIKSDQNLAAYRNFVNTLVHPAGTKLFGRTRLYEIFEPTATEVDFAEISENFFGLVPLINFNFLNISVLPDLITFTRGSTATYRDSTGTRQLAGINVPRFDHTPSGAPLGFLSEGSRTNSFLNSDMPVNHTSPNLSTGSHTLWIEGSGSITVAANTATITGAGTATAGNPVTYNVTGAGTVDFTVTGSPTIAQNENGTFPSSYIPTTNSAATRAADVATIAASAIPLISAGAVSIMAEYSQPIIATGGLLSLDNGNFNNLIGFEMGAPSGNLSGAIWTGGGSQVSWSSMAAASINGQAIRAFITAATNDAAAGVNGSTLRTDNSLTVPPYNILRIGFSAFNNRWLWGHFRKIIVFDSRLTNTQLEAIIS